MELTNEQTQDLATPLAMTGQQEGEGEQKVLLGKFKDVNALVVAYNSLQAEFTKRCQRIKELEGAKTLTDKETSPNKDFEGMTVQEETKVDLQKEQIVKNYLKELLEIKSKAIVMDGVGMGVATPQERPKTLEQAGNLAKEIFNN